jgi:hypothetical protein
METRNHHERSAWSSRPHYTPRQLLTADQLNAGIEDELKRQRLLNRAIHGYGVVEGFGPVVGEGGALVLEQGCLELTGGLAIDRYGRMLYWDGGRIGMHDIVGRRPEQEGTYTLCAHFACRPPRVDECLPLAGARSQWWKEGVVFTLQSECDTVDRTCPDHPEGRCIDHDHFLCRRTGALPGDDDGDIAVSDDVPWLVKDPSAPDCPTGRDGWVYDPDPDVCVPIARVEICDLANDRSEKEEDPECDPRYGFCSTAPDPCGVRPYVYRNPLLYELVKECDVSLSRVQAISWSDWIERGWSHEVDWKEFADRIAYRHDPSAGDDAAYDQGFVIRFTRPIAVETIHPASIVLTSSVLDRFRYYRISRAVRLDFRFLERNGPLAHGVRLEPHEEWVEEEVQNEESSLNSGAYFELTIRGQLLRDACGHTLDARPLDVDPDARGQAMPGGDFVSAFRLAPRRRDRQGPDANDQ